MAAEDKYSIQQKLANLKKALDADPTNVEVANHYWAALASFGGNDVRSGGFVIKAFRGCALASRAGLVAFARAYLELFEKSGEQPRAALFDEELLQALKTNSMSSCRHAANWCQGTHESVMVRAVIKT
jgi:hypothetical protein